MLPTRVFALPAGATMRCITTAFAIAISLGVVGPAGAQEVIITSEDSTGGRSSTRFRRGCVKEHTGDSRRA
jgi:hypothetical protein